MDADAIVRAAEKLLDAYDTRTPIDPLIDVYPDAGITDAYRIQQEQVRRWVKAGDAIKGHKVGLASLANTVGPLGITLEACHVVLPGSMTRAEPVRPGDTVVSDMGELGSVTATLAPDGN